MGAAWAEEKATYGQNPATRSIPITDSSNLIHKRVTELEHLVTTLEEKLHLVMRPSYPTSVPTDAEKSDDVSSPLRDELGIINGRLALLCRKLDDIGNRLET